MCLKAIDYRDSKMVAAQTRDNYSEAFKLSYLNRKTGIHLKFRNCSVFDNGLHIVVKRSKIDYLKDLGSLQSWFSAFMGILNC